MEKEALIQGFKERLGENAAVVSDRSYDEIATVALPAFADDNAITDETWKLPVQMLNTLVGQYRHDVAAGITNGKAKWAADNEAANKKAIEDAVAKAKAEWEASNKKPEPDPGAKGKKTELSELISSIVAESTKNLLSEDGAIGKLSKSVADLTGVYQKQQREALVSGLKKQVVDYLKELKADKEPAINLAVKQLEFGENSDVDQLKLQAKKNYETIFKEFYGDGGKPYGGAAPTPGGRGLVDDYIKSKAEISQKEAQDAEALRKSFK